MSKWYLVWLKRENELSIDTSDHDMAVCVRGLDKDNAILCAKIACAGTEGYYDTPIDKDEYTVLRIVEAEVIEHAS